jgi:hypothetical protein
MPSGGFKPPGRLLVTGGGAVRLKAGESFEVTETDKYNARRFTVKAR